MQKISDGTPAECPECHMPGERQISGGAGLVFKGSGFYITDYKRSGEKKKAAESDKTEGAQGKSSKKKDKPKPGADS
jgi:predicted nucleic acid-binding Zn ribbon protein